MTRRGPRSRSRAALPRPPIAPARPARGRATPDPRVARPELEEEPFDEPALVCGGVETAVPPVAVGGADPWESEPDAACDPLPIPDRDPGVEGTVGTVTGGTVGTVTGGTVGTVTVGTVTVGTVTVGTVTVGTVTVGTVGTVGTVIDGTVIDGTVTPGTLTDGKVSALLARGCTPNAASNPTPRAATARTRWAARVRRAADRARSRVDDSGRTHVRAS